jgi:hypothetical protein
LIQSNPDVDCIKNVAENISDERAIDAFNDGLRRQDFKKELSASSTPIIYHLPIGHRQPIGRWRGLYTLQANIFTRPQ